MDLAVMIIAIAIMLMGGLGAVMVVYQWVLHRWMQWHHLKTSEERLSLVLAGANDGIWDWNILTGDVYLSPRWKQMLGYEDDFPERIEAWKQIIHPDDAPRVEAALESYLSRHSSTYRVEFRARTQDGSYCWILAKGLALWDAHNVAYRMVGSHTNISERKQTEEELRVSELRFRAMFEQAAVGIAQLSLDGRILNVNQTCCEILGCHREELLDRPMIDCLDAHELHADLCLTMSLPTASITSRVFEKRLINHQGKWIWITITFSVVHNEQEQPTHLICVLQNISDRKQAEMALVESAQRERAIARVVQRMHQSLDLTTIFTTTTQELRQAIRGDRVLVYRFKPDWSGDFVAESVDPSWSSVNQLLGQATPTPITNTAVDQQDCRVKDWCLDPSPTLEDTYLKENQGGLYQYGMVCRCVSNIYEQDFDPCYIQLLEQLQAKAYIIVPIFCHRQLWGLLAAYQHDHPRQWGEAEIRIMTQIGTQLGVAVQQAELLATTQQQAQELQMAKDAADFASYAKTNFLANMSHELRTPLNSILGFTQIIQRDPSLTPDTRDYLNIITTSGEHLLSLINDVLDMSKIEAGRMTLTLESFDLHKALSDIREMFYLRASSKGLGLNIECDPAIPQYLHTDEQKLRQVLINLLSNAVKFTRIGHVSVRASLMAEPSSEHQETYDTQTNPSLDPPDKVMVRFDVEDTGEGIEPEAYIHLFEAFTQTKTGIQSGEGTGLGLAISKKLVEMLGGKLAVTSQVGQGSCFSFTIQAERVDAIHYSTAESTHYPVVGLAPDQPPVRILVVEDHPESQQYVAELLEKVGFDVQTASNGEEAISHQQDWLPQIVLMDMNMPIMNGYTATRLIKAQPQPPIIIATTASVFAEQRQAIFEAGCDEIICKPLEANELLHTIGKLFPVYYRHESVATSSEQTTDSITKPNMIEQLMQMSPTWVESLHYAASQCSDDRVLQLLDEIPEMLASLKSYLSRLTTEFQFSEIVQLTQTNEQISSLSVDALTLPRQRS